MICPTIPDGWHVIADKFYEKWNFPHICGALDGKHVACWCTPKTGSMNYNYKGFYSVVLMAFVDADYKFISWKNSSMNSSFYTDREEAVFLTLLFFSSVLSWG